MSPIGQETPPDHKMLRSCCPQSRKKAPGPRVLRGPGIQVGGSGGKPDSVGGRSRVQPFLWATRCRGARCARPAPEPVDTGAGRGRRELLALARGGVCRALPVAGKAVRSYRTLSPLPRTPCGAVRRSALCCTVPRTRPRVRVAVSHHRVQSCPDFPPPGPRTGAAAACPRPHPSGARPGPDARSGARGAKSTAATRVARIAAWIPDVPSAHAALMAVIFTRRYSWR